jgi:hypothetical protein
LVPAVWALETAELAECVPGCLLAGFVQNLWPEKRGWTLEGIPVFYIEDIRSLIADHVAVCASGNQKRLEFIRRAEEMGYIPP